jgi:hypothetical protein
MIPLCSGRRRSLVPLAGKEVWVTITSSSQRSDMIAAGQSMLRPSFPAEIRQAASGTTFDLVTLAASFKRSLHKGLRLINLSNENSGIDRMSRPLNGVIGKLDTGSLGAAE